MDTVVRIDESDPGGQRPALEPANHAQFHKVAIPVDDLSAVPTPGFATNLSSRIGPFA